MENTVTQALRATGLTALAQAYVGSIKRLSGLDISDFDAVDLTALTEEQVSYLEIARSTEQLLPHLTRESPSENGFILGTITTLEVVRLNDSANQLLEKFAEKHPKKSWPRFDPEFELSLNIRHSVLMRL
jgi:hypothetical protein